jgi:excisionase family DNA binding protein
VADAQRRRVRVNMPDCTEGLPPIVNVREFAKYVNVHRVTIHRMIKRGEIQAFRTGGDRGDWRFRREVIEEWIKKRER